HSNKSILDAFENIQLYLRNNQIDQELLETYISSQATTLALIHMSGFMANTRDTNSGSPMVARNHTFGCTYDWDTLTPIIDLIKHSDNGELLLNVLNSDFSDSMSSLAIFARIFSR